MTQGRLGGGLAGGGRSAAGVAVVGLLREWVVALFVWPAELQRGLQVA